ncbi:MAG: glucose-1-phosphate adenylyltransferase [Candidatus Omnitrophota bacterium]|nr:glucose-1-phosphate adenylyltransferase [Candidatus Omnitrophota bacterium]
MRKVLTFILAGGKGERLNPLTRDRAKPAVPFGGIYRIIDFTLSNCVNSGIRRIHVLIQYKSFSLQRHLIMGWNIFASELGEFIDVIPAQQRIGSNWYEGTADAIFQNLYTVEDENPDEILILAGDHVYKMNYYQMIDYHREMGADMTVACVEMAKEKSPEVGVIEVDKKDCVKSFEEKPQNPKTIIGKPGKIFASMGIYVFNRESLNEELKDDAQKKTDHDFGKNIIPQMIGKGKKVSAYNFVDEKGKPQYWRDIGTRDAYYQANMELIKHNPQFNIYDSNWPIRTYQEQFPPAKTMCGGKDHTSCSGLMIDSLISGGCVIMAAKLQRSVLSPNVFIEEGAEVSDSILMEGVVVGKNSKIRNAIIDKKVIVPVNSVIGFNSEEDKKRFTLTTSGIVFVAKKTHI